MGKSCLGDYEDAVLEDVWYELEGAYEVFGIGRCRFVLVHCRTAMLMGVALLAKNKGLPISERGLATTVQKLGMPTHLIDSCVNVARAGRYESILRGSLDEQELAATILSNTLETFEWIRNEMASG